MTLSADKLYELLPAIYRIRDNEQNGVLRELVEVIAEQVAVIEEDLDQLYDDQFIETCAEWVVPYIGDLINYKPVHNINAAGTARAEVSNTIGFRARKGTASMLEELANDTTGWNAVAVEFFQRIATTQYLNHLRPNHRISANINDAKSLAFINTAFDELPHNIDVRRISSQRGFYNIPNIGLFLWRIKNYQWQDTPAAQLDARRFHFHPLGIDIALYNQPDTEAEIEQLATRENVAMPIKRRYLKQHLQQFYGISKSIVIKRAGVEILSTDIHVCDLSDTGGGQWANMPSAGVAIDPELGRIAFASDVDTQVNPVVSHFYYGALADIGGGSYERLASLSANPDILVPTAQPDMQNAVNASNGSGLIQIEDSGIYTDDPLKIEVKQNKILTIQAANRAKPLIATNSEIILGGDSSGEIELNGLLISGATLRVPVNVNGQPNRLQKLRIKHCTLVPGISLDVNGDPLQAGAPSLLVEIPELEIEIENSIVGALHIHENANLKISNSIIDANDVNGIAYSDLSGSYGGTLEIINSTVIGGVKSRLIHNATNTIFTSDVVVERVQQGCMRFSYLPVNSRTPRRYRCLPKDSEQAEHVRPCFAALRWNDAAYCQLRQYESFEIANGAEDGSEMGVYHDLYQNKREMNLRTRLHEYLRFGLEAGIIYVT